MRILLLLSVAAYYATSFNAVIADSDFGSKFFKAVAKHVYGNVVCSSLSVEVLLSLMTLGATGRTRCELRSVLQTNDKHHAAHVQDFFSKVDKSFVYMYNNIFLPNSFEVERNFKQNMTKFHIAPTASIDFGNPTAARRIINNWCAAHTNNRITDVIWDGLLNEYPSVLLVNAMYFHGSWLYPFDVAKTKLRAFTVDGASKDVPTMHIIKQLRYGKLPEINASYVEVPYVSDDTLHEISMYVILPDEVNGFEQLKGNLEKVTVNQLVQNAKDRLVDLFLPKFKIESWRQLAGPLRKMGLTNMFSGWTYFDVIGENGWPNRVQFVQKVFIGVTEMGTETADATSASSHTGSGADEASVDRITFDVNRSFVGIVAVKRRGAFLSAVIVDPQTE